jgi:hypothetical protein
MTTLTALWYDFKRRRRDEKSPICRFRDDIPGLCASQATAEDALRLAVRSKRASGKMHTHQSKVSKALPLFERSLFDHLGSLAVAKNFDQLYRMMELIATPGIGPLTLYDVATRFGAYLGLKPERIYLHTGAQDGVRALRVTTSGHEDSIPMDRLPAILRNKDPDEVEDFLCCYCSVFPLLFHE